MRQYWNADGDWTNCPYFNFNDDQVKFNANRVNNANQNFGSVSGFLGSVNNPNSESILLTCFLSPGGGIGVEYTAGRSER